MNYGDRAVAAMVAPSLDLDLVDATERACLILKDYGIFKFSVAKAAEPKKKLHGFAETLGEVLVQDDTDVMGIKTLESEVATRGSKFHTDRASMDLPPEVCLIFCAQQATRGGESIFVDGRDLISCMPAEMVEAFSRPKTVCFGYPKYLRITQILNVTKNGRSYLRYRNDDWAYFSPHIWNHLSQLEKLLISLTRTIKLKPGSGIAFRNDWFLHGARPSTNGERVIHRLLVNKTRVAYGAA